MTSRQFQQRMKDTKADLLNDGKEIEDCALDVADCLLYEREIRRYIVKHYGIERPETMRELLADLIFG